MKIQYKDYVGQVQIDDDQRCLSGYIAGIKDVVTFSGDTVEELIKAFHDSVDDYLEFCKQLKKSPAKVSGNLMLRMTPELYARVHTASNESSMSMNKWIIDQLDTACRTKYAL